MNGLRRYAELADRGILGINRRNAEYILDHNPRHRFPFVDSKQRLAELCETLGISTPELYGVVGSHSALRRLPEILRNRDSFVVKPNRGAAGRGILVITGRQGDRFQRHNGEWIRDLDIRQHIADIVSGLYSLGGQDDAALIQRRVVPHPVFEPISYQGTGDIRLILYRHVPAMAMLRLPTRRSGGRANLHQGAIGAGVDLESGETCHAVVGNHAAQRHPDTGKPVIGFRVPFWQEILDMSRTVSQAVGMGYLGVDIVLDRDHGAQLLEANARPGLAIQIANDAGLLPRLQAIDRQLGEEQEAPRPSEFPSPTAPRVGPLPGRVS